MSADNALELVRAWLLKAAHDLEASRVLAARDEPLLDVAIYHCQQAAEKSVKRFLVFAGREFGKTHDLEALVSLAAEADAGFSDWVDLADGLTPYATSYRYPSEQVDPDPAEFAEAIQAATSFAEFVLSRLHVEAHPETGPTCQRRSSTCDGLRREVLIGFSRGIRQCTPPLQIAGEH